MKHDKGERCVVRLFDLKKCVLKLVTFLGEMRHLQTLLNTIFVGFFDPMLNKMVFSTHCNLSQLEFSVKLRVFRTLKTMCFYN